MKTININNVEYPTYATVEEADIYFNAKFGSAWNDVENKEQLLVTATRLIDEFHYQGLVLDCDQVQQFPRMICCKVIEADNKNLIVCCCEIANAIYNTNLSSVSTPNAENIKTMSVGDTSITYKDGANIETDSYLAVAKPIIKRFLASVIEGNIKVIL